MNLFTKLISVLFIQNELWKLPLTNIYSTITPDMLHQVKKGVWEHLINLTLGIIKQTSNSRTANQLILELDLRIRLVPRYPGLKKFNKGISNLSQITAAEYQQLMRVCLISETNYYAHEHSINFCSFLQGLHPLCERPAAII
jgi:Plavaka transposase